MTDDGAHCRALVRQRKPSADAGFHWKPPRGNPAPASGNQWKSLRGRHDGPAVASGDWRKSEASVMNTVRHRPAAANNHQRPAAAVSDYYLRAYYSPTMAMSGSASAGAGLSPAQPWLQAIFQMRQQAASLWSFEHSTYFVMPSYCREQLLGVSHGNPRAMRKLMP
ncbi:hypothetical protein DFH08DRAFT_805253 [Mycena albidolilacea]|uniref:Uncharacterized protein n=1 Tax=Mycena albidolilacea TaxID=1033008 RepID=A0AAD7A8Y9_9AGAR|nr:hypothetical protein DFH08DRAFT_805253 [Mycena albidolilacea]